MIVKEIKTRKFIPPQDSLDNLLDFIPRLKENSIVVISSKVISICEGRCVSTTTISHEEIVNQTADLVLEPKKRGDNDMVLSQIGSILTESAGIDSSNADGFYILLPLHPFKTAKTVWSMLKKRDKIKRLGIVIADSHSVPRRRGAIGFALASYGFRASNDYMDQRDVFGKEFRFTSSDVADSLAAAAVLVMGEGNETTPLAVIGDVSNIKFFSRSISILADRRYSWVSPVYDVYGPLLGAKGWRKRRQHRKF